jgi:hypothetical protein
MTKEDHTPEETDFIKWGLLYKRRNGMGKWTREPWQYRFFTLTVDGVLNYYDMGNDPIGSNSEDSRPRGQLALGYMNYTLVREPSIDGAPSKFAIQIQPENGESWNMCADTEADHGQWCLELEHFLHVDLSKKGRRDSQLSSYDNDGDLASARSKAKDESSPAKGGNPTSPSSATSKLPGKNGDAPTAGGKSAPTKSGKSGSFLKMNKKHTKGMFTISNLETLMAVAIVNYCFYIFYSYTVDEGGSSLHFLWSKVIDSLNALVLLQLVKTKDILASIGVKTVLALVYYISGNTILVLTLDFRASRADKLEEDAKALKEELTSAYKAQEAAEGSGSVRERKSSFISEEGPVMVNGKPVPGCTLEEVFTPQRLSEPHTWSRIDSSEFNVRMPKYSKLKKKGPSPPALYEPFAVDIFSTHQRLDHATQKFSLPDDLVKVDTHHDGVPPIMVIQIQIPVDEPSYMNPVEDGPGWSIMMYFKITEKTLAELKDIDSASPAVKLWARWCSKAIETDELRKRFKFIASCSNLIELGVPQRIADYNAKPLLIRRTGTLYRGVNNSYMEFDMHIHKFDTTAKKAIHYMTSMAGEMFMQIAFVIEGRQEDELPEAIFGAIACNRPQEELASFIFD